MDDKFPEWFQIMGQNRIDQGSKSKGQQEESSNSNKKANPNSLGHSSDVGINREPNVNNSACHTDDQSADRNVISQSAAGDVIWENQQSRHTSIIQPVVDDVIRETQQSRHTSGSKSRVSNGVEQNNFSDSNSSPKLRPRTVSRSRSRVNSRNLNAKTNKQVISGSLAVHGSTNTDKTISK